MKKIIIIIIFIFSVNLFSVSETGLTRVILDNGMIVILKEKNDIPMVAMQMWVKTGSITEGKYLGTGLSHYIEHMLFKGTKKRKTHDFSNDIRRIGGSDLNAYTSYDKTVYHFSIHKEYLDKGIEALADVIQNSIFEKNSTIKEGKVILKEMNMRDDSPDSYLWRIFMKTAYNKHPYRHPIIGYKNLFKLSTRKDLVDYYNTMYSPNNMILVIVGNFNTTSTLKKIKSAFKNFKRKKLIPAYIPKEPKQIALRQITKEYNIKTTKIVMGYQTVNALSQDVASLDVLSLILGQGKTSRLYKKLKDKSQLVNSVSVSSWTPKYQGLFLISLNLDKQNISKIFNVIEKEITKIKKIGVSPRELKRAKQKIQVDHIKTMQTINGYARSLASGEFLGEPHYDKIYLNAIRKVQNKDIIKVANKYLNQQNLTNAILIPKSSSKNNNNVKKIPKKRISNIEKIILKNGATLVLKKDRSVPMVAISSVFNGGYGYENKHNMGIYNLLTNTLLKGTRTKSANKIAELVEDNGSTLFSTSSTNFISINGLFLKQNFKKGIGLLLDILSYAQFPNNEINKQKKLIYAAIKQRDDSIWSASRFHLRRLRYKQHPYSYDGLGTISTIKNISRKDLIKLYRKTITPKNIVISIVGDFNKKEILKLLSKKSLFNQIKFKKSQKLKTIPKLNSIIKDVYYKKGLKQSLVKILFDAPGYHNSDQYPLMMLTHIFSGIGSRLFSDLREKQTLAYATGGFYFQRISKGGFIFYIATEPAKRKYAIKELLKHIKQIKEKPISKQELEIAKNSTISPIIKRLQTLTGQANLYAVNTKLKLNIYHHLNTIEQIKKISEKDIQKIANKYFNLNKHVISIVEPKNNS